MWQDDPQVLFEHELFQGLLPSSEIDNYAEPSLSDALLTDHPEDPAPTSPSGPYITVFCGTLVGRLYLELFRCPGIYEPCIQLQGEMISPKEFTKRSDNRKNKDWKGNIRTEQRSLRYMMDTKKIEFFNHKEFCSGKCQGRYHGANGKIRPDCVRSIPVPVYPMAPMYTPPCHYTPYPLPINPAPQPCLPMQNPMGYYPPPPPSIMCTPAAPLYPQQIYYPSATGDVVQDGQMTYAVMGCPYGTTSPPPPPVIPGVMTTEHLMGLVTNDPGMFWNEVRRVGLLSDFLETIGNNISGLRLSAMDPNFDIGTIAPTLTGLIEALELKPYVVSRIQMNQTAFYGTMPCGDINHPLPHDQTAPCYNQAPVHNPGGSDLSTSLLYPLYAGDRVVDSEADVADPEYQDPKDRPPPSSPIRTSKRRRAVVSYAESDDEE